MFLVDVGDYMRNQHPRDEDSFTCQIMASRLIMNDLMGIFEEDKLLCEQWLLPLSKKSTTKEVRANSQSASSTSLKSVDVFY